MKNVFYIIFNCFFIQTKTICEILGLVLSLKLLKIGVETGKTILLKFGIFDWFF